MIEIRLPFIALTAALKARLDAELAPTKVYDFVEENEPFPYVVLFEASMSYSGTKGVAVSDPVIPVHIWSEYEGALQAETIANQTVRSVTRSNLDLSASGFKVCGTYLDGVDLSTEWNGQIARRHATVRFRWKIVDQS